MQCDLLIIRVGLLFRPPYGFATYWSLARVVHSVELLYGSHLYERGSRASFNWCYKLQLRSAALLPRILCND